MTLLRPDHLRAEVRSVRQRLLDALAEEECLFDEELRDEDFEQWKRSRKAAEQLAVDYTAIVRLYLDAVRTEFPKP